MRAKASIPAWGKWTLAGASIFALAVMLTAPGWVVRPDPCAGLNASIEAVRSGRTASAASDAWVERGRLEKHGWRTTAISVERGAFRGRLTRFQVRHCLGNEWIEEPAEGLQPAWVREAWVFHRESWPRVIYREGVQGGHRVQIVIQGREP